MVGAAGLWGIGTAEQGMVGIELVEVIQIYFTLTCLVLELGPGPGRPGECRITEDVGKGSVGLFVGGCRVEFKHSLGKGTVLRTDIVLILS